MFMMFIFHSHWSSGQGFNMALQMGGPGTDTGQTIGADAAGNVYICRNIWQHS